MAYLKRRCASALACALPSLASTFSGSMRVDNSSQNHGLQTAWLPIAATFVALLAFSLLSGGACLAVLVVACSAVLWRLVGNPARLACGRSTAPSAEAPHDDRPQDHNSPNHEVVRQG